MRRAVGAVGEWGIGGAYIANNTASVAFFFENGKDVVTTRQPCQD